MAIVVHFKLGVKNVWCSNTHFIIFRDFIIFQNCIIRHKALGDLTFEYISYSHFLNDGRTTDQITKLLSVS